MIWDKETNVVSMEEHLRKVLTEWRPKCLNDVRYNRPFRCQELQRKKVGKGQDRKGGLVRYKSD